MLAAAFEQSVTWDRPISIRLNWNFHHTSHRNLPLVKKHVHGCLKWIIWGRLLEKYVGHFLVDIPSCISCLVADILDLNSIYSFLFQDTCKSKNSSTVLNQFTHHFFHTRKAECTHWTRICGIKPWNWPLVLQTWLLHSPWSKKIKSYNSGFHSEALVSEKPHLFFQLHCNCT